MGWLRQNWTGKLGGTDKIRNSPNYYSITDSFSEVSNVAPYSGIIHRVQVLVAVTPPTIWQDQIPGSEGIRYRFAGSGGGRYG